MVLFLGLVNLLMWYLLTFLSIVACPCVQGLSIITETNPDLFFFCREDEESLRDKIRADHERALQEAKEKLRKSREELQAEIQTEKNKVMEDMKKKDPGPKPLPPVPMPMVVGVSDGEPPEPDVKEKRDKIREVRGTLTSYTSL